MDDQCALCGEPVELVEIFNRELYEIGEFVCDRCTAQTEYALN